MTCTTCRIARALLPAGRILALLLAAACGRDDAAPAGERGAAATTSTTTSAQTAPAAPSLTVTFTADQHKLAGIELGTVEQRNLSAVVKLSGVIDVEPSSAAVVSAPLGGYVRSAGLLPGAAVRKGQVIATLENPEFIQIQQDYLESKGRMVFLEQEYARQQRLRNEDVNSAKTFQQVASEFNVMRARITGLEQKMAQAGIPRGPTDNGRISRTANLFAPISGFIKASNVSLGKYVSPTDVLFEIVNTNDLHLALDVYERDLQLVRIGQSVRFATADESTLDRSARIFLVGRASGTDRVTPVHGHIATASARGLVPGMYVRAWVETGAESLPAVPIAALVQLGGKDYLVIEESVAAAGHRYRLQEVRRATEQGGYIGLVLPERFDVSRARVVVKNAYAVLAALKGAQEEE